MSAEHEFDYKVCNSWREDFLIFFNSVCINKYMAYIAYHKNDVLFGFCFILFQMTTISLRRFVSYIRHDNVLREIFPPVN